MKYLNKLPVLAAAACLSAAIPITTFAATFTVLDPAEDTVAGLVSLREAVTAANTNMASGDAAAGDADEVDVIDVTLGVALTLGEIEITEDLIINIQATSTITQDSTEARIFNIADTATVTITGGTLTGGDPSEGDGGAILNAGTLTLSDVTITENTATAAASNGGGIANTGTLTITGGTISDNTANRAGGGLENTGGTATLTDVTISGNMATGGADGEAAGDDGAPGNGGGIHSSPADTSVLTVTGGSVTENTAGREGGGIWAGGSSTIDGTEVTDNIGLGTGASTGGGGLFNQAGTMTIVDAIITGNTATMGSGSGGGILNNAAGTLTITSSVVSNNTANRAGGGIEDNGGTVTLNDLTMDGNNTGLDPATAAPGNGGAVHGGGAGEFEINGGEFTNNVAAAEGGAIWTSGATLLDGSTITDNTASGNDADQGGGGLFNEGGDMTIADATISDNTADGTSGSGGGILNNAGSLALDTVTMSGNTANRAGGALEDNSPSALTELNNVTMADNIASGGDDGEDSSADSAPGNGGAIHISGPGDMAIIGGSFTDNTAAREGGALWNSSGEMELRFVNIDGNTSNGSVAADDGGGGIFNNGGTVLIDQSDINNNLALEGLGSGGGILNNGGDMVILQTVMNGNRSARAGGAIEDNAGTGITIFASQLVANETIGGGVAGSPGNGGGVHITGAGSLRLIASELAENFAANEGGALWNFASSTMQVAVSTLSGNDSPTGSAIFQNGSGTGIEVGDSTIANNENGAALELGNDQQEGSITVNNSILSNNAGGDSSGVINGNFNAVENGIITGDSNIVGAVGLADLANNGGPTRTHAISAAPALNAADPEGCGVESDIDTEFPRDFDQRGFSRDPAVSNCDIGAFELVDSAVATAILNAGGNATANAGDNNVAALSFGFNNPEAASDAIIVESFSGRILAGDQVTNAIDALRLYLDVNADGAFDAGDTELTNNEIQFSTAGGRFSVELDGDVQTVAAGETVNFLLVIDVSGGSMATAMSVSGIKLNNGTPAGVFLLPLMLLIPLFRRGRAAMLSTVMAIGLVACGSNSPTTAINSAGANTIQLQLTAAEAFTETDDEQVLVTQLPLDGTVITIVQ